MCNISNDNAAELRTLATTDELYISAPYFTPHEATLIKTTLVSPPHLDEIPEFETLGYEDEEESGDVETRQDHAQKRLASPQQSPVAPDPELITIEEAIKTRLSTFFDKRRASGDARPCGPHDMGPIYLAVFGIGKGELKDEKFLSRLRRAGLPRSEAEVQDVRRGAGRMRKGGRKG